MVDVKEVGMLNALKVYVQGLMGKLDDVDFEAEALGAQEADAEAHADADAEVAEAAAEEPPPRISSRCVTM